MENDKPILDILDQARWAPSGDNEQPWRFEIAGTDHVVVHGHDTRDHCVYDLDGHASQIAHGALIETAAIAASEHGLRLSFMRRPASPEARPVFDLKFTPDPSLQRDPLVDVITKRSVQRKPLSTRALTADEKRAIENALPDGYSIRWLEGAAQRRRCAMLMFRSAHIRLTTPEAYEVHRHIIDWGRQFSTTKVPDQALGVGKPVLTMMRFVLQDWRRVAFSNRFLAGTWMPRLQMDLWTGLRCGAHYVLLSDKPAQTIDDYVAAGAAVQRAWLAMTSVGLQMQPEATPVIFARYAREGRPFSRVAASTETARFVATSLEELVGGLDVARRAVFMGRIGAGPTATARSTRMSLSELQFRG